MGKRIPTRPFEQIDPNRESYLEQLLGRRRNGAPPDVVLRARALSRRLESAVKARPILAVTLTAAAAFGLGSILGRRAAGALAAGIGGFALLLFLRGPGKSEVDRIMALGDPDYDDANG
jgi:hypothetical protein